RATRLPGVATVGVSMRRVTALLVTLTLLAACSSSGSSRDAREHLTPVPAHCEPLAGGGCLLPYPSDSFTVSDPSTPTGRRLALDPSVMPKSSSGTPVDPTEWNRVDGF